MNKMTNGSKNAYKIGKELKGKQVNLSRVMT